MSTTAEGRSRPNGRRTARWKYGVGSGRSALSSLARWVSPARPPNRTCSSHRIRLSMCSCRRIRRPVLAIAQWCSFVCMASTRDSASIEQGHEAPVFTSDLLASHRCCEHTGPLRHVHGFPVLGLLRVLRPTSPASTGDRSSPPYRQGPTKWFPRSLSNPSTGSVPSYAPATSPRLRRSPSPWPPGRRHQPAKEFPARPSRSGARCNPAPICQVRAGGLLLRGFLPLVPRVHLSVSLAGPAPSDSPGASRRCQGCFRLHRCPRGQAALSFSRPAATGRWRWSLTTARFKSASWRSTPPNQSCAVRKAGAFARRGSTLHRWRPGPHRQPGQDSTRLISFEKHAGFDVALKGLHSVTRPDKAKPAEIGRYARDTRIWSVPKPCLEAVVADGA